jgi:hypothetical protein
MCPTTSSPWSPWSRALTLAAALAALAACAASRAEFTPAQNAGATSTGPLAAYYDLRIGAERVGSAKVWSAGSYPARLGDDGRAKVVEVNLRVRNDGARPLTLVPEETSVEITTDGRDFRVLGPPVSHRGALVVAPGASQRIQLYYALPARVAPGDVDGFELNWTLRTEAGAYSQSTRSSPAATRRIP